MTKVYVKSGQLEWVGNATGPLDAVKRALQEVYDGMTLDSSYFFVDRRGFRDYGDAEDNVPLTEGFDYAGFVFDE